MTMINKLKRFRGVTIVELLIYMGLMSIFLVVLLDIFTTTLQTKLSSESTSGISQDENYILAKLSYDIGNASAVTQPTLGVNGNSLQITINGVAVKYSLIGGNLIRNAAGVPMALNGLDTSLDSITFTNMGNPGGKPTIRIIYTVRSKIVLSGGQQQTQTVTTTVGTR